MPNKTGVGIVLDRSVFDPEKMSMEAKFIVNMILPDIIATFLKKNADYGDTSYDLGIQGQYAELWRKVGKLKGPMWEGQPLEFEQVDEILGDLIGHELLTLYFLSKQTAEAATPVAAPHLIAEAANAKDEGIVAVDPIRIDPSQLSDYDRPATIHGVPLTDRDDNYHIAAMGCFNPHCVNAAHYFAKDA